jgi:hypothetical protein
MCPILLDLLVMSAKKSTDREVGEPVEELEAVEAVAQVIQAESMAISL